MINECIEPVIFTQGLGDLVKVSNHVEYTYCSLGEVIDKCVYPPSIKVKFKDVNNNEKELWFHCSIANSIFPPTEGVPAEVIRNCEDERYFLSKAMVYPYEKTMWEREKEAELNKNIIEEKPKTKRKTNKKIN